MWPTWGPPGADRTRVGPMLAPWTLLSKLWRCTLLSWWRVINENRILIRPVADFGDKYRCFLLRSCCSGLYGTNVFKGADHQYLIINHTATNMAALSNFAHSLQWRHNGRDSVSNHQLHYCLLNGLFRRRSKKTSKIRVTGLLAGISLETGEFPAQMASYTENVSIWWRHRGTQPCRWSVSVKTVLIYLLVNQYDDVC